MGMSGTLKIATVSLVLLLAACGGGGGGSGSSTGNGSFNSGTGFDSTVEVVAFAIDGSGDIYVGGNFTQYNGTARNRIARINSDGSLDNDFNPGIGFSGIVTAIAPATDGSGDIYVGGQFTDYDGTVVNNIARLNSNGSLDAGFMTGAGINSFVIAIEPATDSSGNIYVGGAFTDYNGTPVNRIVRIDSNGTLDAGFDTGSGFNGTVRSLSLATDGSGDIYAGGDFTEYRGNNRRGIARIDSNGANVGSFTPGTGFSEAAPSVSTGVFDVLAPDGGSGDVYVAGRFATFNGVTRNDIVRLDSNGDNVSAFGSGSGSDTAIIEIALAADGSGDIYAVGGFGTYRGNARSGITRINSDGSNDGAFNPGSGDDGSAVFDIAVTGDGIYLGGPFATYQTAAANRIVRIDTTGAPN